MTKPVTPQPVLSDHWSSTLSNEAVLVFYDQFPSSDTSLHWQFIPLSVDSQQLSYPILVSTRTTKLPWIAWTSSTKFINSADWRLIRGYSRQRLSIWWTGFEAKIDGRYDGTENGEMNIVFTGLLPRAGFATFMIIRLLTDFRASPDYSSRTGVPVLTRSSASAVKTASKLSSIASNWILHPSCWTISNCDFIKGPYLNDKNPTFRILASQNTAL